MSGGHFEYNDRLIKDMIEIIEDDISQEYVDEEWKMTYTKEQLEYMNKLKKLLIKVVKLTHSYDYALSGDTELDDFVKDYKKLMEQ